MRTKLSILLGFVILLVGAMPGLTQIPQGGAGGGGFGGGFGGGKGMRGGGGGGFGDPSQMFERMTGGKSVWVRSEITDQRQQGFFDRIATGLNITNGQITKEQFQQGMASFRGGRGGMGGGQGAGGGNGAQGGGNWADNMAENMFRRQDQNQDGVLNNDEMPENLRLELDKWDTDKNGLIDLNEFKAWFQARMQQVMADRNSQGSDQAESERKPPIGYRIGKLPKELPAWFGELDLNQDAQIGLYEWKTSGRSLDEFNKIDRNGDGFLTVEEVLRYEASQGRGPQPASGADGMIAGAGNGMSATGMAPGAPGGVPGRTSFYTPGGSQPASWGSGGQGGWGGQQGYGGKGKGRGGEGRRSGKGGGDPSRWSKKGG